jgi:RND family efflux transporter MFP subunit
MTRHVSRTVFVVVLGLVLSVTVVSLWWYRRLPPVIDSFRGVSSAPPGAAAQSANQPLAPFQVSPERLQRIGVTFGAARVKPLHQDIRTVGTVVVDERRVTAVQSRVSGWITHVSADASFQHVDAGQTLLTIDSDDVLATEQEYLIARRNQETLGKSEIVGVASGAATLVAAAEARLHRWQVPDREIDRLRSSGDARSEVTIESPIAGYIVERHALPNQRVESDTRLYTIADLTTVWVEAAVLQEDLPHVHPGDAVIVTAPSGMAVSGSVDAIYPEVDLTTRTGKVRIVTANPRLALTPGMSLNVTLEVPLGTRLVIASSAVFQSGARVIVFVDRGGGSLEPRPVETGAQVGDEVIVLKGLEAGERVVTSAGFLLDSESQLQSALGAFVPPPPGAGVAAAMPTPTIPEPPQIALTTKPSPPRKGANLFRVRLTDVNGAAVLGAQVTVQRFMPAMPNMGMPAMSGTTPLVDRGAGVYEGPVTLESGGAWRITIAAVSHGATVATKQISLTATGGMTP